MAQAGEIEEAAFYDSGMIVALARGRADPHYEGVARLDAFAEQNDWSVITSPLAVMESVSVVRRRAAMSHKYRSGGDGEMAAVDAKVRRAADNLRRSMSDMASRRRFRIVDHGSRPLNFALLEAKMWEHPGYAVPGARGQPCRHRGVGPHDWLHFESAARAGASIICTTDAALADVEGNDAEFGHIRILLAKDPPPPI